MAVVSETAEVVAPSNLEGGYHLDVDVNGVTRTVIVVRAFVNVFLNCTGGQGAVVKFMATTRFKTHSH